MNETKLTPGQIEQELNQFSGTTTWFRHWTGALLYTDGVQWLADKAGAFWLIDAIASWQEECRKHPTLHEMQFWRLCVDRERRTAVLECIADEGESVLVSQAIEYTDFPLVEIKLWVIAGGPQGRMVLMLPSEY